MPAIIEYKRQHFVKLPLSYLNSVAVLFFEQRAESQLFLSQNWRHLTGCGFLGTTYSTYIGMPWSTFALLSLLTKNLTIVSRIVRSNPKLQQCIPLLLSVARCCLVWKETQLLFWCGTARINQRNETISPKKTLATKDQYVSIHYENKRYSPSEHARNIPLCTANSTFYYIRNTSNCWGSRP